MISTIKCAGQSGWTKLVEAEYREMPGMSLTKPQIRRMWGLDNAACEAIVEELIRAHVLRLARDGHYVAFDSAAP